MPTGHHFFLNGIDNVVYYIDILYILYIVSIASLHDLTREVFDDAYAANDG